MKTPSTEPDLTFHWPVEKGFPFVLFVCVAGSLLAHAATFFLFQVVYPERVTIPQPAPHVSLLTPSSPENIALLRWIEAEDPALIASDNSVPPPGLAEIRYRPSFATMRTPPLGAPAEKSQEVAFPPAIEKLVAEKALLSTVPSAPLANGPTRIQFAGELATRPLARNPPLGAPRCATAPVSPTVLLIGVDAQGEIRHHLRQETSGDARLDDLAIAHLRRLNFATAESPMTWAYVTFAWGADAYAETADADSPTPGSR